MHASDGTLLFINRTKERIKRKREGKPNELRDNLSCTETDL